MQARSVVSVLVENNSGVLARVAGLFGRRGYNIDSLTVSSTDTPDISRMTIVARGEPDVLNQIVLQTEKLQETVKAFPLCESTTLERELLLVKIEATEKDISGLRSTCDIYKARIVDISVGSVVVELTGRPEKIEAFLKIAKAHKIIEMCRTGATAMERGADTYIN